MGKRKKAKSHAVLEVDQYVLYTTNFAVDQPEWHVGKIIAIEAGDSCDSLLVSRFIFMPDRSEKKFVYCFGTFYSAFMP